MINIRVFNDLEQARAAGAEGLYSPHFDVVKDKPARNYKIVEGSQTFITDFDDNGWMREPIIGSVGDVVYAFGNTIKTVPLSGWTSQGEPIGVVVIPSNFLPDKKLRAIALTNIDSAGTPTTDGMIAYGPIAETPLTNYIETVVWNNDVENPTYTTCNGNAFFPSDDYTNKQCACDPLAYYRFPNLASYPPVPSPYLADGTFNTAYSMTRIGETEVINSSSDLDGKGNTVTLVGLGASYKAASACTLYSTTATTAGEWYLPSIGELGFLMARFKIVNTSLERVGGNVIVKDLMSFLLSSTKTESSAVRGISTGSGSCYTLGSPTEEFPVRPFIML